MSTRKTEVVVEGKRMALSNLEKVLYPEVGFTKAQVIDYYVRVAPFLLPHLKNRPLTLKRYPDGVEGLFFYEKQCPSHRPEWVKTARTPRRKEPTAIDYCVVDSLSALVWIANLADLELHTFLHCTGALDVPTAMVFDLDPGPPADIHACCRLALKLRQRLADDGLEAFAKTSGSKGLQVYVPLNIPVHYEQTKAFAHQIALDLSAGHPQEVLSTMNKGMRTGKVFVDWSQNHAAKTTVCVYSLRAKAQPLVSTPLTWEEIEAAQRPRRPLAFDTAAVLKRVQKQGDLFEPVLTLRQKLKKPNV